jgi:hypothetical protein
VARGRRSAATRWSRRLARPVGVRAGPELRTLADARAYILSLRDGEQKENRWQHATKLLLEACETGDVGPVTKQVEYALMVSMKLVMR